MSVAAPPTRSPLHEFLVLAGRWVVEARRALADSGTWRPLLVPQMRKLGVESVPVALFVAVFTGIVLALGPGRPGRALAGRVGANVAAELGTMRVTEQVDALETLAISPHAYLVTPRVLAATLMFPAVTAMAMALGVLSGWFTAVNILDLSSVEFLRGARQFYKTKDIWFGLVKSASFGTAVATMGCFQGLDARGGAEGVGRATTRAVVLGCQAILVLDAFWALVLL